MLALLTHLISHRNTRRSFHVQLLVALFSIFLSSFANRFRPEFRALNRLNRGLCGTNARFLTRPYPLGIIKRDIRERAASVSSFQWVFCHKPISLTDQLLLTRACKQSDRFLLPRHMHEGKHDAEPKIQLEASNKT